MLSGVGVLGMLVGVGWLTGAMAIGEFVEFKVLPERVRHSESARACRNAGMTRAKLLNRHRLALARHALAEANLLGGNGAIEERAAWIRLIKKDGETLQSKSLAVQIDRDLEQSSPSDQTFWLNIFEPEGDTVTLRPLCQRTTLITSDPALRSTVGIACVRPEVYEAISSAIKPEIGRDGSRAVGEDSRRDADTKDGEGRAADMGRGSAYAKFVAELKHLEGLLDRLEGRKSYRMESPTRHGEKEPERETSHTRHREDTGHGEKSPRRKEGGHARQRADGRHDQREQEKRASPRHGAESHGQQKSPKHKEKGQPRQKEETHQHTCPCRCAGESKRLEGLLEALEGKTREVSEAQDKLTSNLALALELVKAVELVSRSPSPPMYSPGMPMPGYSPCSADSSLPSPFYAHDPLCGNITPTHQ